MNEEKIVIAPIWTFDWSEPYLCGEGKEAYVNPAPVRLHGKMSKGSDRLTIGIGYQQEYALTLKHWEILKAHVDELIKQANA